MSTKTVLACYPDPEFTYDDVTKSGISIATATVANVELKTTETTSCWHVEYSDAKYLYGHGTHEFSVTTCADEAYQVGALSEETEGLEYLGFIQNAKVLLGVVDVNEDVSDRRYAILSCWGPLHVNLRKMSGEERAEFLRGIKTLVENTR